MDLKSLLNKNTVYLILILFFGIMIMFQLSKSVKVFEGFDSSHGGLPGSAQGAPAGETNVQKSDKDNATTATVQTFSF